MFLRWPAHVYDKHGTLLAVTTAIYAMPYLISDDRRVFRKVSEIGGVLRFHEADPDVPNERDLVDDVYRQLADAGL